MTSVELMTSLELIVVTIMQVSALTTTHDTSKPQGRTVCSRSKRPSTATTAPATTPVQLHLLARYQLNNFSRFVLFVAHQTLTNRGIDPEIMPNMVIDLQFIAIVYKYGGGEL